MIRPSLWNAIRKLETPGPHERRLLHVTRFIDRHGRARVYVRNPNTKRKKSIALTGVSMARLSPLHAPGPASWGDDFTGGAILMPLVSALAPPEIAALGRLSEEAGSAS